MEKNNVFGFRVIESKSVDGGIFIDPQILKNDPQFSKRIKETLDLCSDAIKEIANSEDELSTNGDE